VSDTYTRICGEAALSQEGAFAGSACRMRPQHLVSVSGGKDSTATYLLALESGRPFRAVFADTGNEHELTLEYVARLAERAHLKHLISESCAKLDALERDAKRARTP